MSTSKRIDLFGIAAGLLAVIICALFVGGESLGIQKTEAVTGYESRLFDTSRVHTVDIVMDDWEGFLATCESEEYSSCSVIIDGEAYSGVGIRGKGNTSLSTVSSLDSDRYSFKIEFDQYDSSKSYYGLDKLSLNNLIQDATMMKDYLVYQLMAEMGAAAPLCSFVYITVNGEDWGLYLAVEGVEDAFLQRNYGSDHGELYKPDAMSFGGGRGNGKDFQMEDFVQQDETDNSVQRYERPAGGMGGGMGSADVKLQYIDDDPASYSNIFSSAKTDVTEADQTRLIAALKTLSEGDAANSVMVENVIRYFVVHNFVVNGDSYTGSMIHNYYLYEENGLLAMLPWDYNLAFGTFQGGDATSSVNSPIDTPVSGGTGEDRPMANWIFDSEEYLALYHQYFEEFLAAVDFGALIDETAELIAPYVEKDPTAFYSVEEFEAGVAAIREFCLLREQSVLGQLDGTIPATTEGQNANPAVLIDASQLTLSDMGSMNMGGGRGGFAPDRNEMQGSESGNLPAMDGEMPAMPGEEVGNTQEGEQFFPQMGGEGQPIPPGDGTFPQMGQPSGENRGEGFPQRGERPADFGGMMAPSADGSMGNTMQRPEETEMSVSEGMNGGGLLWLGVSAVILLAGLLVAFRFKRR